MHCTWLATALHLQSSSPRIQLTLYRRQAQFLGNLRIPYLGRILQRHPANQFGQVARARDRAPAAEGLELDVADGVVIGVDPDLQLHDVSACGGADEPGADVGVGLGHGADIARAVVVV